MNIFIQHLELTNFKCFRHKEINFDGNITVIRGHNGSGKTTVADAILWCLFGKNTAGQADFDLKTHDSDGNTIPNLDHSVELRLLCDDSIVTLRRTLKETWVKKRGSNEQVFKNNTTEYLINGEVKTATDYKKYISELVSEEIFRAITNPSYFPSLKWQVQRDFLSNLAGDIAPDTNDVEFVALLKQLTDSKEDIISYLKHLSYQIKKVKDQLDTIPVRLEEQNKALPELLDWPALEAQWAQLNNAQAAVDAQLNQIKQGDGSELKREELRRKRDELRQQADALKDKAEDVYEQNKANKQKAVNDLSIKFNDALNTQRLLEQTIQADERLIERAKSTDYEAELQKLREQWPSSRFTIDPNAAYCPTCGQAIPQEQYQEKVEQMRTAFNLAREAKIKELNEKASAIKAEQAQAAEELERLELKLADDKSLLEETKKNINLIFSYKAQAEKAQLHTVDELLKPTDYDKLLEEINQLNTAIVQQVTSDDDQKRIEELQKEKQELGISISAVMGKLATRQLYDHVQSLIADIHEKEQGLIAQLSELERKEDIARRYQARQNTILESRINEHFKLVKWKLFRTVNNGGEPFDEPYCECYVDGVAYHDGLNQAARLNAGLDIISCLCKHYNVSAPICIDNSESCLNIMQTTSQQLRLEVFDSPLQIL